MPCRPTPLPSSAWPDGSLALTRSRRSGATCATARSRSSACPRTSWSPRVSVSSALASRAYVRRAALLGGIEEFDAEFFGFTPQAARMIDPQHRLFLQCAWHALEDAGLDPRPTRGRRRRLRNEFDQRLSAAQPDVELRPERDHRPGRHLRDGPLSLQNDKDHLATRVAHQLDLRGPALVGADRVLVVAGRGAPGLPEPAHRGMRHGAGRRRVASGCPTGWATGTSRGRWCPPAATAGRSTCVGRNHFRQRSRNRGAQAAAGRRWRTATGSTR